MRCLHGITDSIHMSLQAPGADDGHVSIRLETVKRLFHKLLLNHKFS